MPETSKFKSKSKPTASPSKLHLSGSTSSDNEGLEGDGENRPRSSRGEDRPRFWFMGRSEGKKYRVKSQASQQKKPESPPQDKEMAAPKLPMTIHRSYDRSGSPSVSSNRPSRQHSQTKQKRPNSRFSLRNLIYGNPLFAQHFGQATTSSRQAGSTSSHRGTSTGSKKGLSKSSAGVGRFPDDVQSDTRSVMRDSLSLHGPTVSGATSGTKECPLCLSDRTLDQYPVLRNCVHCFCIECLQTYVKIEIQEGRVNLRCPQCTEHLHPNDIESLIGDKNSSLLTLYESLMLRRILAGDPDIRWCPGPNCTFAVIAQGCASCPKLDCERPGCGYSFCYHCKAEWHPDQTCEGAMNQRFQAGQTRFPLLRSNSADFSLNSLGHSSEYKLCPRCAALIMKMDDGSCNHMTCPVCGAEFCWLCMKEISDLHYLSPSGCTFWGKKPWSRKKKLLWQLGTIIGAPVGIALLACISIPAMIIGIPSYVGRKIHDKFKYASKIKRNLAVVGGVVGSVILSPALAVLAVSIGVPVLLCYVYAVVPIALCRSEGCGISTSENGGVKIEIEEDYGYRPVVSDVGSISNTRGVIANPSIGEMSLGASLSLGSGCHLERDETETGTREVDRESASNTAMAGASLTGSVASSYLGGIHFMGHSATSGTGLSYLHHGGLGVHHLNRLEVSADVHTGRKKFSLSSERLSETVSLSERSTTVSLAEDTAFGRVIAGNFLSYKLGDNQSVSSYRTTGECCDQNPTSGDDTSLRSLPMVAINQASTQILVNSSQNPSGNQQGLIATSAQPRSLSPVSCQSGDDLGYLIGGRKSLRSRRPLFDKQLSENSSLLSGEDTTSERVRFDDNVSFIDDCPEVIIDQSPCASTNENVMPLTRIMKGNKLESLILPEETAEELAEVVSPEPHQRKASASFSIPVSDQIIQPSNTNENKERPDHVTLVNVRHDSCILELQAGDNSAEVMD